MNARFRIQFDDSKRRMRILSSAEKDRLFKGEQIRVRIRQLNRIRDSG